MPEANAIGVARPGSTVGYVGVPQRVELPVETMLFQDIGLRGGGAPVRMYIPELLDDVPSRGAVFDFDIDLDGIAAAYAAMDKRRAIKSLARVRMV